MKTRVISAVVGIAIFIAVIYFMPKNVAVFAFSLICALAAYEFLGETKVLKGSNLLYVCVVTAFFIPALTSYTSAFNILPLVYVFALIVFLWGIYHPEKVGFNEISKAFLGTIIIPFLLSSVIRILVHYENGSVLILLPFITAWGSDCMALWVGVLFGKHKLAPKVSPKKTVEGAIGGVFGGVLAVMIFAFITGRYFNTVPNYWLLALAGIIGSLAGEVGDLSLSLIKRNVGIKDYGKIMPGHGGILDRFDSVLFTAPLFEILLHFTEII